jgi:hypothetical protein
MVGKMNQGSGDLYVSLRQLDSLLGTMPTIEDLFLGIVELRAYVSRLDLETKNSAVEILADLLRVQSENADASGDTVLNAGANGTTLTPNQKIEVPDTTWEVAGSKRKRTRVQKTGNATRAKQSSNSFSLLMDG